MTKKIVCTIALILVLASLMSTCALAAQAPDPMQPQNSNYIHNYRAYIYSPGSGEAQVWFEIKANVTSDKVGTTSIVLQMQEDDGGWTNVKTFYPSGYSNMMATDAIRNVSYVQKTVDTGHYYRAFVTFYVENNGGSDTRYYTTDSVYI